MGLFNNPGHCDVNIVPFDNNLLDIDRFAPEHLFGLPFKNDKQVPPRSFSSTSIDSGHSPEYAVEPLGKYEP